MGTDRVSGGLNMETLFDSKLEDHAIPANHNAFCIPIFLCCHRQPITFCAQRYANLVDTSISVMQKSSLAIADEKI